MLQLSNIIKTYYTGEFKQNALNGVSMNFRENEFVSILGPSGSGKTTLLNIIGGLDRYTSGDLIINGVSTKDYKDADWDYYRNNSIGFVFQNYNLIPHQSVLSNVEMALTLAGVSKAERKARAEEVLDKVGLREHMHKRPNQLSGGQMQRVAIARALVNNPDILLADEPTGALDSETSKQVMDVLRDIAKDKLVIMVTHNAEIAERYSTRIIKLRDGAVIDDTDCCMASEITVKPEKHKKISMSFGTALALSFNNLRTKKARTILTALAGSIGIIGIALILSLSNGVNDYILDVQRDALSSYPITIESSTIDTSALTDTMLGGSSSSGNTDRDGIYVDYNDIEQSDLLESSIKENNLTAFKKYLDNPKSKINKYLGENGIVYGYDISYSVFSYDADGAFVDNESTIGDDSSSAMYEEMYGIDSSMLSMTGSSSGGNFSELMPGAGGSDISKALTDSYKVLAGNWPKAYNEVVLVLDGNNSLSTLQLYQLGFITEKQYTNAVNSIKEGKQAEEITFDYKNALNHKYYMVPACDKYTKNEDGTYTLIGDSERNADKLKASAIELKIVGVVKPEADAKNVSISTAIGYTSKLTDFVIKHTAASEVVKAQQASPETNVITGRPFVDTTKADKVADTIAYLQKLSEEDKVSVFSMLQYYDAEKAQEKLSEVQMKVFEEAQQTMMGDVGESLMNQISARVQTALGKAMNDASAKYQKVMEKFVSELEAAMKDESGATPVPSIPDVASIFSNIDLEKYMDASTLDVPGMEDILSSMTLDNSSIAQALDAWVADDPSEKVLERLYDAYIGGNNYDANLKSFGYVSYDAPSYISIYADDFESKDKIAECIDDYNKKAKEDEQITYTDYVALLTDSVTTIVDSISYVLIAFVAISLIVSCIMIGIITHISVLERTREIGILRALGASKSNISQVFNAETFIVGCASGILGILLSLLLLLPINSIIHNVTDITAMSAKLPVLSALILIAISIVITVIGGLIPSIKAARKDPVAALRTE